VSAGAEVSQVSSHALFTSSPRLSITLGRYSLLGVQGSASIIGSGAVSVPSGQRLLSVDVRAPLGE
jgi:hypothetical protein